MKRIVCLICGGDCITQKDIFINNVEQNFWTCPNCIRLWGWTSEEDINEFSFPYAYREEDSEKEKVRGITVEKKW